MASTIIKDFGTNFVRHSVRFLQDEEEGKKEESKGISINAIIHVIAFMLAGVTLILILYACFKFLAFFNNQKRIQVVQSTTAFESRDNIELPRKSSSVTP